MTPVFSSALEEIVFWVVFLFGMAASAIIDENGVQQAKKSQKATGDKNTVLLLNVVTFASLTAAVLLGYTRIGALPSFLFYPGLLVYVLGIAYANWAAVTLGRFFAPTVQVQLEHRVVDQGPYRFIRHPRYAGALLAFLGLGLALQSAAALLVLMTVMGAGYAYRIRVEEEFLVVELGDAYVEYCKRTKRVIPFIF